MTVLMFAGQGSQFIGMGQDYFQKFPELIQQADALLGYSIEKLCLEENENLNNTRFTQPALFVVEVMQYLSYCESHSKPDYCLGHSLGEYGALFAAGAFDFKTGLQLLKKRGELMSHESDGTMLSVMGLSVDEIKSIIAEHNLKNIFLSNFNSPKQTVISGGQAAIDQAQVVFEDEMAMCTPLKVSNAFHSPYMDEAKEEFAAFLEDFEFQPLQIPVVANVSAHFYENGDIRKNLTEHFTSPVLWTDSIQLLSRKGEADFEEVGPKKTLSNLLKYIV